MAHLAGSESDERTKYDSSHLSMIHTLPDHELDWASLEPVAVETPC